MFRKELRLIAALLGALGVAAAAFGAHGLEKVASPEQLRWWAMGAAMHLVTAPVVLFSTTPGDERPHAGALLLVGIFLFSGSLYLMALGGARFLGAVTPLGGLLLIAGWLALGFPKKTGA